MKERVLDLQLPKKIVHQQSGQILAELVLRKGTTFYFTIPIDRKKIL
jgi:signal transduction histidine kinase